MTKHRYSPLRVFTVLIFGVLMLFNNMVLANSALIEHPVLSAKCEYMGHADAVTSSHPMVNMAVMSTMDGMTMMTRSVSITTSITAPLKQHHSGDCQGSCCAHFGLVTDLPLVQDLALASHIEPILQQPLHPHMPVAGYFSLPDPPPRLRTSLA